MATEVVSTIRSSGGDYTSLSAWEAGEQGDLTGVRDEISVAECYDDWPSGLTGGVIIDGWTTDATRYIKVTVAAGHRHNGIDPTSGFYLAANANSRNDLRIYEGYTVVEYVGHIFSTYTGCSFVLVSGGTGSVVRNCLSTDTEAASNNRAFWVQNAGSTVTWQCCLSIAAAAGFYFSNSGIYTALNCVAADCTTGFTGSSNSVVKNCVAYNNTTNYSGTFSASSTHNATSSASDDAPGGSSVISVSSSDFVDAANNDFHLASGSVLIGAGTNLYSDFTTDIDGDTWPSSGAWDIGFDYRVAGGGDVTVNLSGISASFAQTSPVISSTVALSGESATASAGIVLPAFSAALSGQAIVAAAGGLSSSSSCALSSQSATFAAGSVVPSVAIAVIGLQATFAAGTLTASSSGGDTAALTGEVVSFAQTAPSVSVTIALTGIAATMSAGILSASSGTATITVKAGSWLRYKKLQ